MSRKTCTVGAKTPGCLSHGCGRSWSPAPRAPWCDPVGLGATGGAIRGEATMESPRLGKRPARSEGQTHRPTLPRDSASRTPSPEAAPGPRPPGPRATISLFIKTYPDGGGVVTGNRNRRAPSTVIKTGRRAAQPPPSPATTRLCLQVPKEPPALAGRGNQAKLPPGASRGGSTVTVAWTVRLPRFLLSKGKPWRLGAAAGVTPALQARTPAQPHPVYSWERGSFLV